MTIVVTTARQFNGPWVCHESSDQERRHHDPGPRDDEVRGGRDEGRQPAGGEVGDAVQVRDPDADSQQDKMCTCQAFFISISRSKHANTLGVSVCTPNAKMGSSVIRELLKLTEQPDIISFAGGLPAPEVFPVKEFQDACNRTC
jgi:hypothetical protein